MTDIFQKEKRSQIMSRIGGKNTKPELILRSFLHKMGYRYSLHKESIIGKPDICLPKYGTVIFVHGCYWHRHANCKRGKSIPSTNQNFWKSKFEGTVKRDRKVRRQLKKQNWNVITIWQCELSKPETLTKKLKKAIDRSPN